MYSPIIKILFFTFVLYKTTEAAVEIFPPEDKPAKYADQEGCFLISLDIVLEIGVPFFPKDGRSCQQYTCNENGETQLFTCGAKEVGDNCEEIEGDKTLAYPDCCNRVRCLQEDGTYTEI